MNKLNGAVDLTPAEFAAQHPPEATAARRKQAERDRQAEADRAKEVVAQLLQGPERDRQALQTLLGTPPADPAAHGRQSIHAVLRTQAEYMQARGLPVTDILAALQRTLADTDPEGWLLDLDYRLAQPVDWLIPDWLPTGEVGLLTGGSGRGKSMMALQLGMALAGGGGWTLLGGECGLPAPPDAADPRTVLYAGYEDRAKHIVRRLDWLEKQIAESDTEPRTRRSRAPDGLRVLNPDRLRRAGPLWGREPNMQSTGVRLAAWQILEAVARQLDRLDLLIVDPLGMAYAGNEVDRGEVSRFVNDLAVLASDLSDDLECAVLILSHPPKSAKGDVDDLNDMVSGSTAWGGSIRYAWGLTALPRPPAFDDSGPQSWEPADGTAGLACLKQSQGLRPASLPLRMEPGLQGGVWHCLSPDEWNGMAQAAPEPKPRRDRKPQSGKMARNDAHNEQARPPSFLTDLEMQ